MKESILYEKLSDNKVKCGLCAHRCTIKPSASGICRVRVNKEGILYSLVYGAVIAEHIDPIEKKPMFHVHPGSQSFSIATAGCNFRCSFCQNYEISQTPHAIEEIKFNYTSPEDLVEKAARSACNTISYTYTEPTVFFEYALDTGKIAHERGIGNIFVTNGFMTSEALDMIAPYLDGANVDLKSYRDDFYRNNCGARLQPVLDSLKKMKELGIWVEVTTLLIPGLNDTEEELHEIAAFIRTLGAETPWHVSRFYPRYRMTGTPSTSVSTIHQAVKIGKDAGLKYVYSGNVPGDEGENTSCSQCGLTLIRRVGYQVIENKLRISSCPRCATQLEGIF